MKKQNLKLVLCLIGIIVAGVCYSCNQPESTVLSLETDMLIESSLATALIEDTTQQTQALVYIYICGAVHNPGVYQMEPGSRVFQVVEKAGGFTEEAVPGHLNLAQVVNDGMKIVVFSKDQAGQELILQNNLEDEGGSEQRKININTAAKEQLMTLRGIGEARAEDIIRYREQHGPFKSVEDIMQVSGIKQSAFEKIKDDIMV